MKHRSLRTKQIHSPERLELEPRSESGTCPVTRATEGGPGGTRRGESSHFAKL